MPAPTSSPRPKANPNYSANANTGTQQSARDANRDSNGDKAAAAEAARLAALRNQPAANAKPTGTSAAPAGVVVANPAPIPPRAPDQPATPAPIAPNGDKKPNSPKLPVDAVEAERGNKRPDRTLIDALNQPTAQRTAQKYKGSVLASVYKLPVDGTKSAKTLQQFNGPRGQKTTLGA